jgi:hypothetical protein
VKALKQAFDHGFSNCRLLMEDQDLKSIREYAGIKEILERRCHQ